MWSGMLFHSRGAKMEKVYCTIRCVMTRNSQLESANGAKSMGRRDWFEFGCKVGRRRIGDDGEKQHRSV